MNGDRQAPPAPPIRSLWWYSRAVRWVPFRSYAGKLGAVGFLCVHLPLIAVVALGIGGGPTSRTELLLTTVGATLVATTLLLLALSHLTAPVRLATDSMEAYVEGRTLPQLPEWNDEAGQLLRAVSELCHVVDAEWLALQKLADHDSLTGLLNRRGGDERLVASLGLAHREHVPFSVVIIDLDGFKAVNDEFGHRAGDELLVDAAEALRRIVRAEDWIARWGGDEFLIGVHAPEDDAIDIAERAREALARTDRPLTASVGVSSYRSGDSPETLVERSDQALYVAKSQGRNQIASSPVEVTP